MDSTQARTQHSETGGIADRVSAKVSKALKSEKAFAQGSLLLPALIAGEIADVVAGLTAERRRELNTHSVELKKRVRQMVEGFSQEQPGKIRLDVPDRIELSKGEGLGPVVTPDQGKHALDEIAVSRRLEDWAGPIAGATELNRDYGVARSSLHRWQQDDDVIGLLKGTKKHVYPVGQFVDGRPARGLRDVIKLAGSHRVAWLWLIQPNPVFGGRAPIDLLKQDRVDVVADAAASYFIVP